VKNPKKRLGCLKGHSNDVRDHKWFNMIKWLEINSQLVAAPFLPKKVEPLEVACKSPRKREEPLKIARTDLYKTNFIDF
jgi:hypothetical protein